MKQYAVLGLGIFGSTVAKTLSEYNCEVLAIDKDITCVERVSEFVTQAVQADITDINQLKDIGLQEFDVAIVATGSHLEESILAVMNCKQLGIEYVVAKARNKRYKEILEKIGADKVTRPEKETGERVAKSLLSRNIVDLIDIDDDYSIIEIIVPQKWVGKSFVELDLRRKHNINVLGTRKPGTKKLNIQISPDSILEDNEHLLVVGLTKEFEKHDYLEKL